MVVLIVYTFTVAIYAAATAMPSTLHKAPIAIVDEDDSTLSARILSAFYPPHFLAPERISLAEVDPAMDEGRYTFVLDIPPDFEADVLAGRSPSVQVNVDATRMSQAFTGNGYIQQIILGEVNEFVQGVRTDMTMPVELVLRARFNPALESTWFGSVMELITVIT